MGARQPDPKLTDPREIAIIHGFAGTLDPIVRAPTVPLELPVQLLTPYPFLAYLRRMAKRTPQIAAGFPTRPTISPYASFLSHACGTRTIFVWPGTVVVGSTSYQTPAWVRALMVAERPHARRSMRPLTYAQALAILEQVIDVVYQEQDSDAGEGHVHGDAVAR